MAKLSKCFSIMAFACLLFFVSDLKAKTTTSPIKHLNLSLWSEYKKVKLDSLDQSEKTKKLEDIFKDKLQFVQTHAIRRLIVKILNPNTYFFFHPENFNEENPNNFFYWASKLSDYVKIEVLFDASSFQLMESSFFDHLNEYYKYFKGYFHQQLPNFGAFQNIIEKMEWVSITNDLYGSQDKKKPLISGITLNFSDMEYEDSVCQNVINAFDQFRFSCLDEANVPEWMPNNSFYPLKIGLMLPLDKKELALANISSFPLSKNLKSIQNPEKLGIQLPDNYPSSAPNYLPPSWRPPSYKRSMADTVYLNLGDHRLIPTIYQNYKILSKPFIPNPEAVNSLNKLLNMTFQAIPFIKGPGHITCLKGSSKIKGTYTFFFTGSPKGKGKFTKDQLIEIRPPYLDVAISRRVKKIDSNRDMEISSAFTTTKDIKNAEYFLSPIPVNWTVPAISSALKSKIYFVFNIDYDPQKDQFFGNWCLENFIQFLYHGNKKEGFLFYPLFTNFQNQRVLPHNNIVLDDFTCLPNGVPYPESNWKLGNQSY